MYVSYEKQEPATIHLSCCWCGLNGNEDFYRQPVFSSLTWEFPSSTEDVAMRWFIKNTQWQFIMEVSVSWFC